MYADPKLNATTIAPITSGGTSILNRLKLNMSNVTNAPVKALACTLRVGMDVGWLINLGSLGFMSISI